MRAHGKSKFSTPPCRRKPPRTPAVGLLLVLGVECSFIVSPRAHVYMHDPPWLSRQDVLDRMLLLSDPGIQLLIFFNFHIFSLTHSKCVETLAVLCLPTIGGKKIYTNLLIDQVLLDCYPSYRTQRSHYDPWFLEYYLTDYQLPSSLYIIHLFGQLTAESRPDQSSDDVVASFGTPTTGSDVYVCTVNIDFPPFEKFSSDRISRK